MSEILKLKNSQLRFSELELKRHLLERGCPRGDIQRLLVKYSRIQLAAEPQLWDDLPVISLHRPFTECALSSPTSLPIDILEQLTGIAEINRSAEGLNRGHVIVQNFPSLDDKPNARSNSEYDLRQNIMVWQKPVIQKMEPFISENPDSLFVLNTYARAHIARGAVMLPAVNYCLGAIFRNQSGNISAMHMHRSEQPCIDDIANLLEESSQLFGDNKIAGGHLTLIGMEFPWELLEDRPEIKIPLLYRSPQINDLCAANSITASRFPVGLDQKEIRVWQAYATTNTPDPVIGSVDITKHQGYTITPKGYRELVSELTSAYGQEP